MRRLGTPLTLAVLGLAALAGAGVGLAGHAVAPGSAGPSRGPSRGPSSGASRGPSPGTAAPRFLGAANLVAPGGFEELGWYGVTVEGQGNGEPQFAYACQRRALAASSPAGTISATWNLHGSFTAAETVAELTSPPQARALFVRLGSWYEHCSPGPGPATPTELVDTVRTARGTAQVWRIGSDARRPAYGVVARGALRVGLVDLYSDAAPPDPAGLGALARDVVDRLG